MSGGSSEQKKHPASESKLKKKREEGSVANSQESSGMLGGVVGLGLIAVTSGVIWQKTHLMIKTSTDFMHMPFPEASRAILTSVGGVFLWILLPIIATTLTTTILTAVLYNNGINFAIKAVSPKASRVDPAGGLKRILGKRGFIESGLALVRVVIWLAVMSAIAFIHVPDLLNLPECKGACFAAKILPLFWVSVISAAVLLIVFAVVDMIIQRKLFLGEQKMTETEVKRERKDLNGSQEVRTERNRLLQEAKDDIDIDVDIDNATMCFFHDDKAVAIQFQPPLATIPYVMAKAEDADTSMALRKRVFDNGWPELDHANLTRAGLIRPLGKSIDKEMFVQFVQATKLMFETS